MPTYIERAYISIKSNEFSGEEITEILGVVPTATRDRDAMAHPRRAPYRYSWTLESASTSEWVGDHVEDLRPAFERLSDPATQIIDERDFVVYGFARELGYVYGMSAAQLDLVQAARCALWWDIYTPSLSERSRDAELEDDEENKDAQGAAAERTPVPIVELASGHTIRVPHFKDQRQLYPLIAAFRGEQLVPGQMYLRFMDDEARDPWVQWLVMESPTGRLVGYAHAALSKGVRYGAVRAHVTAVDVNEGGDAARQALLGHLVLWAKRAGATEIVVPESIALLAHGPYGPMATTSSRVVRLDA